VDQAGGPGLLDLGRGGVVGEVEHHQRLEAAAGGAGRQDALAVGKCLVGGTRRRHQVGHHDGAAEVARHGRHGVGEGGAVAQVDMPVIRSGDGQGGGHGGLLQAGRGGQMLPDSDVAHSLEKLRRREPPPVGTPLSPPRRGWHIARPVAPHPHPATFWRPPG
jgi:hypothetical protein